jgi:putative Holliday junction resolvase
MGLDVGSRTIGVALSDELKVVANGLVTLKRKGTVKDVGALLVLIEEHEVDKVVVGLPLEMSGRLGHRARRVLVLVKALEERWKGRVETWDERLSTKAAERALLEADLSRRKRKDVVDQVAAAIILQGYLDSLPARHRTDGIKAPR